MKEYGQPLEFTSTLSIDNGYASRRLADNVPCRMKIYVWDEDADQPAKKVEHADIEWLYFYNLDDEDVVNIGCNFESGRLVDYDGVFELPKQAIKVLRMNGFTVPREFEQTDI